MRLTEAFEAYRRDVIVFQNQSVKTEEQQCCALNSYLRYLGDIDICDLKFEHIRQWSECMRRDRLSMSTIRNYIIKFRNILRYCQKHKIDTLDWEAVPVPKFSPPKLEYLEAKEVAALIKESKNKMCKAIIALLYASGIRLSELCQLNRDDLKDGHFTVIGKGGKQRLCFYDVRSEVLIDNYLETRDDNNPALFVTQRGRITSTTVHEICRRTRDRTGMKQLHPHIFRHSFATNCMANGMPIYCLQRMLGHSNMQTTAIYLHVTDPKLQEEYGKYHSI